jgi:hypothetical protein
VSNGWAVVGEPGRPPTRRHGNEYAWRLTRGDETRYVTVFISADAREAVEEGVELPQGIEEAVESEGRSIVDGYLASDDPPTLLAVTTEGISVELAGDRQRLDEIRDWFEARGLLLNTAQSGRLWVAAVMRQDVRVAAGDVAGQGTTEVEAAEAALSKYEALEEEAR